VVPGLVRRRSFGWSPSQGLNPAQYGVRARGRFGEHDDPGDGEITSAAVRRYMREVRRILGADWPYGAVYCPLMVAVRRYGVLRLEEPCRLLDCPDCFTGHIGRLGLPVLYHRELPADPSATCRRTAAEGLTLRAAGKLLGVSFQRVYQIERGALRHALVASLVSSARE
jgi:hypothetical protein